MAQLDYPIEQSIGLPGQLADSGLHDIRTYNNPDHFIKFGRAVAKVAGDEDGIELPDALGADIVGVALRDATKEGFSIPAGLSPAVEEEASEVLESYFPRSAVSVLREGRVYVTVEQDVTPDDPVFVRYSGRAQRQVVALDADLVIGNKFRIDVDGFVITVLFAVDHLTTMNAIAAAIQAQPGVGTAVVGGPFNREITVTAAVNGVDVLLENASVAGGAMQPNVTVTETVTGVNNADRGLFRKDGDGATAMQLTDARYLRAASAGHVTTLQLNLT